MVLVPLEVDPALTPLRSWFSQLREDLRQAQEHLTQVSDQVQQCQQHLARLRQTLSDCKVSTYLVTIGSLTYLRFDRARAEQ